MTETSAIARNRLKAGVYTTGQVATICKVAPRTVSKWIDSGKLEGYRIPGSNDRRVTRSKLVTFLREHGMPLDHVASAFRVLLIGLEAGQLRAGLRERGCPSEWAIDIALSGFEAGCKASETSPDCIVIDLGMGRTEALQIARALKDSGALLVGIASEDEAALEQLALFGLAETFKRPFDEALLLERLERHAKDRHW